MNQRYTNYVKKIMTYISYYIGECHKVHYLPMIKKYAYHRMLLRLLAKIECKYLIREAYLSENNYVMIESDYDETLKA